MRGGERGEEREREERERDREREREREREERRKRKKKKRLGGMPIARATSYCLFARHMLTTGLQKCLFKIGSVKIRKFTVTAFHCE